MSEDITLPPEFARLLPPLRFGKTLSGRPYYESSARNTRLEVEYAGDVYDTWRGVFSSDSHPRMCASVDNKASPQEVLTALVVRTKEVMREIIEREALLHELFAALKEKQP